jgi:hypothetical protein
MLNEEKIIQYRNLGDLLGWENHINDRSTGSFLVITVGIRTVILSENE